MAPEVINRQEDGYTPIIDWWSLGALLFEMLTGKTPFSGPKTNRKVVEQNILDASFKIPRHVSVDAGLLIKGLLKRAVFKRIGFNGATEIKSHPFFNGVDWLKIENKEITPPFVPNLVLSSYFIFKFFISGA